mmetsp:Transcript_21870/g.51573  ORF Transcript_21870/g.51573 Transcript_21870/m.51573 type:complete len:226 (+) Transcript_21870:1169-1846(+)
MGSSTSSTRAFWRVSWSFDRRTARSPSSLFMLLVILEASPSASFSSFRASRTTSSFSFSASIANLRVASASASFALTSATLEDSFSSVSMASARSSSVFSFFFCALSNFASKSLSSSYFFLAVSLARCSRTSVRCLTKSSRALPMASSYARRSLIPVSSRNGAKCSSSTSRTFWRRSSASSLASLTPSSASACFFSKLAKVFFELLRRAACSFSFFFVYSKSLFE